MAYSRSRNPDNNNPDTPTTPFGSGAWESAVDMYDTFMSPFRGFLQGLFPKILGGKNLNYEQYMQQLNRKRNPNSNLNFEQHKQQLNRNPNRNYRRVAADSWLKRIMTGK